MKQQTIPGLKTLGIAFCMGIAGITLTNTALAQGPHPHYMKAISDLRAARWLIEHKTGNWVQAEEEHHAVKEIDAALREMQDAAISDGKGMNDHPQVDERPDHEGRLRGALDFLSRARDEVSRAEDNPHARELRNHSIHHIEEASHAIEKAMHHH
jgi:hypothetical protein